MGRREGYHLPRELWWCGNTLTSRSRAWALHPSRRPRTLRLATLPSMACGCATTTLRRRRSSSTLSARTAGPPCLASRALNCHEQEWACSCVVVNSAICFYYYHYKLAVKDLSLEKWL